MKTIILVLICLSYAVLNVSGSALIKWELAKYGHLGCLKEWMLFLSKGRVMLGLCINFASVLMIFKALHLGKFTYVLPVSVGLNFLLAVGLGCFLFQDKMSGLSILGISFILSGIVLMSLAK